MTPATDQTAAASRGRSLPLARRGPSVATDVTTRPYVEFRSPCGRACADQSLAVKRGIASTASQEGVSDEEARLRSGLLVGVGTRASTDSLRHYSVVR